MQVSSVEHFEGRTAVGLAEAVKTQHLLPFIPGCVSLAARMEALIPAELAPSMPSLAP